VGGLPCTIQGSSISSFTCTLSTNTDGSAALVAGSVTPLITIAGLGIVELSSTVSPFTVPLVVSSVSPSTGGNNGGYVIGIVGSGFPSDATKVTVTICAQAAVIQSITNQLIDIVVPSCSIGSQTVTVTVGSSSNTATFNYIAAPAAP
jgi:hypothetical protein